MSVLHEDVGFVLRRVRFAESSLLVTWLTRGQGVLKTSARSALRPGTDFCGRVELFHEARLAWQENRRGEVQILREAELVRSFSPPLSQAYQTLEAAAYFSALVENLLPPGQAVPEIYDLLARGLDHLANNPPSARAVLHFERELARLLGILEPEAGSREVLRALSNYGGSLPPGREKLVNETPPFLRLKVT